LSKADQSGGAAIARRGLMLVLSSPSGAGKSTITRELLKRDPGISMSVSTTTRPKRPGEVDGKDYFFVGKQEKSNREGFVYYIKDELRAAKWRDWKMHIVWEPEPNAGPNHLETPWIFNLTQDPKEETDIGTQASWVRRPLRVLIHEFQQSLKAHPPIPPGAPDDFKPTGPRG